MELATQHRQTLKNASHSTTTKIARLALSLLTVAIMVGACSNTGSYKSFFSRGLDLTFEYPSGEWPEGWLVTPVDRSSESLSVRLLGPTPVNPEHESPVKVSVNIWLELGENAEKRAQDIVSNHISSYEGTPNFRIFKQGTIILDKHSGFLAEYTFDFDTSFFMPRGEGFLLPTRVMFIAIPRNGKVYQMEISASQNEWNAHERDIQHILDTFHWK